MAAQMLLPANRLKHALAEVSKKKASHTKKVKYYTEKEQQIQLACKELEELKRREQTLQTYVDDILEDGVQSPESSATCSAEAPAFPGGQNFLRLHEEEAESAEFSDQGSDMEDSQIVHKLPQDVVALFKEAPNPEWLQIPPIKLADDVIAAYMQSYHFSYRRKGRPNHGTKLKDTYALYKDGVRLPEKEQPPLNRLLTTEQLWEEIEKDVACGPGSGAAGATDRGRYGRLYEAFCFFDFAFEAKRPGFLFESVDPESSSAIVLPDPDLPQYRLPRARVKSFMRAIEKRVEKEKALEKDLREDKKKHTKVWNECIRVSPASIARSLGLV